jgi:hypothetical protein
VSGSKRISIRTKGGGIRIGNRTGRRSPRALASNVEVWLAQNYAGCLGVREPRGTRPDQTAVIVPIRDKQQPVGVVYRNSGRGAKLLRWTECRVIASRASEIGLPELGVGTDLPLSTEDGDGTQAAQRHDLPRASPRRIS